MARLYNLDVDLLRAFVSVADLGSFTRAADALLRRQSTLSLQIKRLEEGLGKRLLERSSRHVRLTAEGERLLGHARQMLALNDRLVATLEEPALAGMVRLGTPEDFATTHLPQVLARFARAYPSVQLEVTCDLTLTLMGRYRQGTVGLGGGRKARCAGKRASAPGRFTSTLRLSQAGDRFVGPHASGLARGL